MCMYVHMYVHTASAMNGSFATEEMNSEEMLAMAQAWVTVEDDPNPPTPYTPPTPSTPPDSLTLSTPPTPPTSPDAPTLI